MYMQYIYIQFTLVLVSQARITHKNVGTKTIKKKLDLYIHKYPLHSLTNGHLDIPIGIKAGPVM